MFKASNFNNCLKQVILMELVMTNNDLNIDLIFYPLVISSNDISPLIVKPSDANIYFIPINQLPNCIKEIFLKFCSKNDEMPKTRAARAIAWAQDFELSKIVEVVSLKTLKTEPRVDFSKTYGIKLETQIHEIILRNRCTKKLPYMGKAVRLRMFNAVSKLTHSKIFPHENCRMIWDTLSQMILDKQPLTKEEKRAVSIRIIEYWREFALRTTIYAENGADSLNQLRMHVNSFKEWISPSFPNAEEFLVEMQSLINPWIDLFSFEYTDNDLLSFFLINFFKQNVQQVQKSIASIAVIPEGSSKNFKQRLILRAEILEAALEVPRENLTPQKSILGKIYAIPPLFHDQKWLEAYQGIIEVLKEYDQYVIDHNLRTKAGLGVNIAEMDLLRLIHFLRALRDDYKYLLKNGCLKELISEVALEEIKKANNSLVDLEPASLGKEFYQWAIELNTKKFSSLKDELRGISACWSDLKRIRGNFKVSGTQDKLDLLLRSIEEDPFEIVSQKFSEVDMSLEGIVNEWGLQLERLNYLIRNVTLSVALALDNPELPSLELNKIKNYFCEFNNRMEQLITPFNLLLNGMKYLFCSDENHLISPILKESNLELELFPTSKDYFQAFETAQTIQQPSEEMAKIDRDIESQIREIFREKKSEKSFDLLINTLRERKIPHSAEYGKGDHLKLRIGKQLIVIPLHETWKPGTLKSISNHVIDAVVELLD